ncbi:MAG: YdeI/OmpD-associated family protein [Planctomycetota bacterium]
MTERSEWRAWLKKHGGSSREVWLIFDKKHTGRAALDYGESVEEALCFGWIDGLLRRIDDERYARKFTPRRDTSEWSAINKERAERMMAEGRMTDAGLAKVEAAKASGAWEAAAGTSPMGGRGVAMPVELAEALKKSKKASKALESLAPSQRKNYLGWVGSAKKAETRQRRAREAVELLASGEEMGMK